jgi:hypothetical protein
MADSSTTPIPAEPLTGLPRQDATRALPMTRRIPP